MPLCSSMPLLVTAMDKNNARHSNTMAQHLGGRQALQGHWHIQPRPKVQSTQAMSPNVQEAACPVCMCGSVCLSV